MLFYIPEDPYFYFLISQIKKPFYMITMVRIHYWILPA